MNDLLKARVRNLEEERHRERVLRLHMLIPEREAASEKTRAGEMEEEAVTAGSNK